MDDCASYSRKWAPHFFSNRSSSAGATKKSATSPYYYVPWLPSCATINGTVRADFKCSFNNVRSSPSFSSSPAALNPSTKSTVLPDYIDCTDIRRQLLWLKWKCKQAIGESRCGRSRRHFDYHSVPCIKVGPFAVLCIENVMYTCLYRQLGAHSSQCERFSANGM